MSDRIIGVGPWEGPWPEDPRYDPELLADGDRRNVTDPYRYWSVEAIRADLASRAHPFHVAIENWEHDMNIGTVVRNANAFGAQAVHVIGRRQWNRRGAMVTDRYCDVRHHPDLDRFATWTEQAGIPVWAVDITARSEPIEASDIPRRVALLFGQEGPGISNAGLELADRVVHITQYGSTRSVNAGVASGVAMHCWLRAHGDPGDSAGPR